MGTSIFAETHANIERAMARGIRKVARPRILAAVVRLRFAWPWTRLAGDAIDAGTGRVEASLRTSVILANSPGGDPLLGPNIAVSPDGKTLYAINSSGKIAVLSVAGYTGH